VPAPPREAASGRKEGQKFLSQVLAKNARDLRNIHELSQDQVAERMGALGHAWSRQTTSDVERGVRKVTVDELLAFALVLEEPIGELLNPRGRLRKFRAAVDPGDEGLPYTEPRTLDDPTPVEIPGSAGIGILPSALQALVESRVVFALAWDDGAVAIRIEPMDGHLNVFRDVVAEYRDRAAKEES